MKDDLKMMKVAMVLFAVIVIYVMIRKPSETLKPDESSGESVGEFQKFQDDSQSGNAFAKRRASEADWAKVRAIAEKFSPQIADLEREREAIIAVGAQAPALIHLPRPIGHIKKEIPNGVSYVMKNRAVFKKERAAWRAKMDEANAPHYEAKRAHRRKIGLAEKAIRDLEREQWAAMGEHLSAFELRKYRMENSFAGRNLREESAWFEPSEGEFLGIFVVKEYFNDFIDQHFEGSKGEMNQMVIDGLEKHHAILTAPNGKTPDERMAEIEADPELQLVNEYLTGNVAVSKSVPQMSVARRTLWQLGENASDESVKAQIDLANIQERKRMGQATIEEVNAARERALEIEIAEMDAEMDAEMEIENADSGEFEE